MIIENHHSSKFSYSVSMTTYRCFIFILHYLIRLNRMDEYVGIYSAGGRFRGVISSAALCINVFRGPLLVFPTVAPEVVPTINLSWGFYRGELVGKSRSGPPLLNAHYNLLLPTVPHDNPPAPPLRFSIGISLHR